MNFVLIVASLALAVAGIVEIVRHHLVVGVAILAIALLVFLIRPMLVRETDDGRDIGTPTTEVNP